MSNTNKQNIVKELKMYQEQEEMELIQYRQQKQGGLKKERKEIKMSNQQARNQQGKLLNEYKENIDAFEKAKNQCLYFGQEIQLMHVNSAKFLACHDVESRYEKENFLITLDDFTSEATSFKIIQAYQYQKDGDLAIYQDEIIQIVRSQAFHNKIAYLHASSDDYDNFQRQQATQLVKKMDSKYPRAGGQEVGRAKTASSKEVNASLEEQTNWRIQIFSEYVHPEDSYLHCGDSLWLHHSERNCILGAYRRDRGTNRYYNSTLNLDTWLSQENLQVYVHSMAHQKESDDFQGTSLGMWIIESEGVVLGGKVLYDTPYRLRHFSTGYYLSVEQFKGSYLSSMVNNGNGGASDDAQSLYFSLSSRLDQSTLFRFYPLKTSNSINEKFIKTSSFIFIKNEKYGKWVSALPPLLALLSSRSRCSRALLCGRLTALGHCIWPLLSGTAVWSSHYSRPSPATWQVDVQAEGGFALGQSSIHQKIFPVIRTDLSENQVFKVYKAKNQEVWELNFVISCSIMLTRFCKQVMKNPIGVTGKDDKNIMTIMGKIDRIMQCVFELDQFCNNKLGNVSTLHKYGTLNASRQVLLREQYLCDILVKILEEVFPKSHLEKYQQIPWIEEEWERIENEQLRLQEQKLLGEREEEFLESAQAQAAASQQQQLVKLAEPSRVQKSKLSKLNKEILEQKDLVYLLKKKCQLSESIYHLLISICKNNKANEEYTFQLVPYFQIHCKYIPAAVNALIQICQNNEKLKYQMSDNLRIEYYYSKKNQQQTEDKNVVKFLINLYDEEEDAAGGAADADTSEKIQFRQHEKISSRPVNLIQYFMNLMWDDTAIHTPEYLKFLSSICRFDERGVSKNQENIYKLFKKYNSVRPKIKFDQYFKSGQLRLPEIDEKLDYWTQLQEFQTKMSEQLTFFSQLSYGRNFLWKKELIPHFSNNYLLQNFWNEKQLSDLKYLRSCFIKLAISLYIDHDPLYRKQYPTLCQLYNDVENPQYLEELRVFKEENNQGNEINMYKNLVEDMMRYFGGIRDQIEMELQDSYRVISDQQIKPQENPKLRLGYKGQNFLNDQLLVNSLELLQTLLRLNLFECLNIQDNYCEIVYYCQVLFSYFRNNIPFTIYTAMSYKNRVNQKFQEKRDKLDSLKNIMKLGAKIGKMGGNLVSNMGLNMGRKKEDEAFEDVGLDTPENDDSEMYRNNVMRGYIVINNQLEQVQFDDPRTYELELQAKMRICDILEHFLDMRQDFLISNFQSWFKHFVVEKAGTADQKSFADLVKEYAQHLLPNIQKTGFDKVDDTYKPKLDCEPKKKKMELNLNLMNLLHEEKVKVGFQKYVDAGFNAAETLSLDQFLSICFERAFNQGSHVESETIDVKDPTSSLLPYLMSSFIQLQNEDLEKKCLGLMMRMFNQRQEFIDNLKKCQVIFDKGKDQLYRLLKRLQRRFQNVVEQSEVWFSEFIYEDPQEQGEEGQKLLPEQGGLLNPDQMQDDDENMFMQCIEVLQMINLSFFESAQVQNSRIVLPERESAQISRGQQQMNQYLKIHEVVIELIRENFAHFQQYLLPDNLSMHKKQNMVDLFSIAYIYLQNFCKNNHDNQMILFQYMDVFLAGLEYDVGQVNLIKEIFRNNLVLLKREVNRAFV